MEPQRLGFVYGVLAYGLWGCFPLFFALLAHVDSAQVIAQRITWSMVFCALLLTALRRWSRVLRVVRDKRLVARLACTGALVGLNWWIYVAAVARGEVVASSLGYFLTPLVSVLLAHVFLGERMNRFQQSAILLALVGVGYLLVTLGSFPLVAVALAFTFAVYGLLRKQETVGPLSGLFVETLLITPVALGYLLWQSLNGQNQFLDEGLFTTALLVSGGVLTALPLLAFAAAAERLSLTIVGFMMYINPSLQFVLAITILGETVNNDQLISFSFIWLGLLVFSIGSIPRRSSKEASHV